MMKRALLAVGVGWLLILVGFVAMKESTLRTGEEVLLKTVPVDPRDLFRGDYVVLAYELSTLDLRALPSDQAGFARGQEVYVTLARHGPYVKAAGVFRRRPSGALAMKGRIVDVDKGAHLRVEYGIESYFVPEGKGRLLERAAGKSLEVKASVDRQGRAAIKALVLNGHEVQFR